MDVYKKRGSLAAITTEAASLTWLAEAAEAGGAPTAELVAVNPDEGWLETRFMQSAHPRARDAARFGKRLAHTHAAGAPHWGAPPPALLPALSRLAELPHPVTLEPEYSSWGEFYAAARVEPYLKLAFNRGALSRKALKDIRTVLDKIAGGSHDSPQPALVDGVARLHGDLWGGNILWERDGIGAIGTLIDPSAHGGHAETDLAELALFGARHLKEILAGYNNVSRLADGWEERIACHQLHMLAVHAALFGGSYGPQLEAAAARC